MPNTDNEIVDAITSYVGGDNYRNWYAGIAADPEVRLFNNHKVDRNFGQWAYINALNDQHARSAESILHARGFDGGPSGGTDDTVYVYAYEKTSSTEE